jgi:RNA polymerase sigma factor (sigma-70 family)
MFGIAYRMLGSATEAEDVLQDAWLRWQSTDLASVRDPAAFLARTVTNLCLSQLTSARARHETYVGSWLPEPVLTAGDALGPLDTVERRDAVSHGILTLLERMSPHERAAWVLREGFGYEYDQLAELLSTSETSARQLVSRARKSLARHPRYVVDRGQWTELVERFLRAAVDGDVHSLERLLAPKAIAIADGGGIVNAARFPVVGGLKVARYLSGVVAKYSTGLEPAFAEINGEPALVAHGADGIATVWFIDIADGLVEGVRLVVNPQKLAYAQAQLSQNAGLLGLS